MLLDLGKTKISLTFPFAAVITLMLLLCRQDIVIVSLLSSFFHECGHLMLMLLFSVKPSLILFGAFGIRIEREDNKLLGYKKEALIALGGVFGNFLLMLVGAVLYLLSHSAWSIELLVVNLLIAAFNLLPIKQLDLGHCLECLLLNSFNGKDSERILKTVSAVTLFLLATVCILYNIFFRFNISLVAVTLYLILISTFKELRDDK